MAKKIYFYNSKNQMHSNTLINCYCLTKYYSKSFHVSFHIIIKKHIMNYL